jgi:hypothetical protein
MLPFPHEQHDTEYARRVHEFALRVTSEPIENLILQGMYHYASIPAVTLPEPRTQGIYEVSACLQPYPEKTCLEQHARTFSKEGYRLGTFRELLALGIQYPHLQHAGSIEAIADFLQCDDGRYVPRLGGTETHRTLGVQWVGARRGSDASFLIVRSLSQVL